MTELTTRERELVALGAALGSNCVPCIEYHVPEARKAGLTDQQISEAIQLADQVRQVPARKVLDTALGLAGKAPAGAGRESLGSDRTEHASTSAPWSRCCG
jgi:4-carboxymuconolactone decarboxylase